jgi:FecR protein
MQDSEKKEYRVMSKAIPVNPRRLAAAILLMAAWFVPAMPAAAQDAAGRVTVLVQSVVAQDASGARNLAASDVVRAGDVIRTGPDSAATLSLADGTELAVGPDSEISLTEYAYDAAANAGKFVLEVTAGAMRFATGSMPKPSYQIRTPSVVTAVRGSIIAVYVTQRGTTYLATEEGSVHVTGRQNAQYTVPAGASLFFNTSGQADGALFNPLKGADLSGLPRGDGPTQELREMDRLLKAASAGSDPASLSPRALGLPFAISQGLIDPAALPPFAAKTPVYNKLKSERDKGGY